MLCKLPSQLVRRLRRSLTCNTRPTQYTTMENKDPDSATNLTSQLNPYFKFASYMLLFPDWYQPTGKCIKIAKTIACFAWMAFNIFTVMHFVLEIVKNYQADGYFSVPNNIIKVLMCLITLTMLAIHLCYLFCDRQIKQLLINYQQLECSLQDGRGCCEIRKPSVAQLVGYTAVPLTAIGIMGFTLLNYFSSDDSSERVFLFQVTTVVPRELSLAIHAINAMYVTVLITLADNIPSLFYEFEERMLKKIESAFVGAFRTNRGMLATRLATFWHNYEKLSLINEKASCLFGIFTLMQQAMNVVLVTALFYYASQHAKGQLCTIAIFGGTVHSIRLAYITLVASQVCKASDDLATTCANVVSANVANLTADQVAVCNSILNRLQLNKLSVNAINLYRVDYSLLLTMLNLIIANILLLSSAK